MAKWTEGPWKFEQGADERDFIVTEPTGNTICEPNAPLYADYTGLDDSIRKITLNEARANAKLIAKAPEMAGMIRELLEELILIRMKDTNAVYDPTVRTRAKMLLAEIE